jgi:hypothetical protein
VFDMDGLRLIVEAVQQRLAEASQCKAQGRTDWWKANTKQCTPSLHVFAAFLFLSSIPDHNPCILFNMQETDCYCSLISLPHLYSGLAAPRGIYSCNWDCG